MDTVGNDMSITEARLAIEEVDAASQLAAQALDDTHPAIAQHVCRRPSNRRRVGG